MAANSSPKKDGKLINLLKSKGPLKAEYPPELMAARRDSFLSQVRQRNRVGSGEAASLDDQEILKLLESLQGVKAEYPPKLLAARRAALMAHYTKRFQPDWLDALRLVVQTVSLKYKAAFQPAPTKRLYVSLIVALMAFVTILGSSTYKTYDQPQLGSQAMVNLGTHAQEISKSVCQAGVLSSRCIAQTVKTNQNLSLRKNGIARAAVSKDTLSDYDGSHQAALVNDGLYGDESRWISKSPYSWLKIDLGQPTLINVVALIGRERVGTFSQNDPGNFVISTALSDDVYANGDSDNDINEYEKVFDSVSTALTDANSDTETATAYFEPVVARFVKITFINPGEAVDEVQVFLINPSRSPAEEQNSITRNNRSPKDTSTNIPTITPKPAHTSTATSAPTSTLEPTSTLQPTDTPWPSSTPTVVVPTDTVPPTVTPTDVPPTDTSEPPTEPVVTPIPLLDDTPTPVPASTAEPIVTP